MPHDLTVPKGPLPPTRTEGSVQALAEAFARRARREAGPAPVRGPLNRRLWEDGEPVAAPPVRPTAAPKGRTLAEVIAERKRKPAPVRRAVEEDEEGQPPDGASAAASILRQRFR